MNNVESTSAGRYRVFTYRFHPIVAPVQQLTEGELTHDQAMARRIEFMMRALPKVGETITLSSKKPICRLKCIQSYGTLSHLTMNARRTGRRHYPQFQTEDFDNYPYVHMFLDTTEAQYLLVQENSNAFPDHQAAARALFTHINKRLSSYSLKVVFDPVLQRTDFWETVRAHVDGISGIKFFVPSKNLSRLDMDIGKAMGLLSKSLAAPGADITINSDSPRTPLELDQDNADLNEIVDASMGGTKAPRVRAVGERRWISINGIPKILKLTAGWLNLILNGGSPAEKLRSYIDDANDEDRADE